MRVKSVDCDLVTGMCYPNSNPSIDYDYTTYEVGKKGVVEIQENIENGNYNYLVIYEGDKGPERIFNPFRVTYYTEPNEKA